MDNRITREIIPFVSREPQAEIAEWISAFSEVSPDPEIVRLADTTAEQRAAARVAIVADPDPAELALLPNLEWVQSLWAGVERLVHDLPDARFEIVRMVDPLMTDSMTEAVLAWTLYLHRDMPRYAIQQTHKEWLQHRLYMPSERTVSILGLGELGQHAAHRLRANGFKVCGWSRTPKEPGDGIVAYHGDQGLGEMLAQTDILVVLLPLTAQTRGLLDHQTLALLPQNAAIINFGRGPIVDNASLLDQLDNGHLSHAVLDVFATEPLEAKSPFWEHPKITVLPHISARTTIASASKIAAANLQRYFATGEIPQAVDRKRGY